MKTSKNFLNTLPQLVQETWCKFSDAHRSRRIEIFTVGCWFTEDLIFPPSSHSSTNVNSVQSIHSHFKTIKVFFRRTIFFIRYLWYTFSQTSRILYWSDLISVIEYKNDGSFFLLDLHRRMFSMIQFPHLLPFFFIIILEIILTKC